jgi:acyl-CoA synthetase (AMP-forming)/AMP-acid ligase II
MHIAADARSEKANRLSLWYPFANNVNRYSKEVCVWTRRDTLTWQEVHDRAVQFGRWFLSMGVKRGDLVAFYLQNSAEFLVIWLGLWSIGCAPAMINFNLKTGSLVHCLKISRAKLLLVDEDKDCRNRIEESRITVESTLGMKIVLVDNTLRNEVAAMPLDVPNDDYRRDVRGISPACLLYTR